VTHEGRLLGTPGYMSPEQARGRAVDARTDVFAMGVVLYEMLTGELPFRGESTMDQLMAIARDPHRPVRERNADVPEALAAIVDKCLAKAPDGRYPSARELAEALEAVSVSADTHVPPSRSGAAATKSLGAAVVSGSGARPPRWALAAAGALVLAIGAGVVAWLSRSPARQPAAGASSAVAAEPSGSVQPVRIADLPAPKTSSPEALHEYAVAVQALADGRLQSCRAHLLRAVQLDPSFASAHLLLGWLRSTPLDDQRKELAAAAQLRAQLSPREAAILEVLQPLLVKNEFHSDKSWRAWKDLTARFPGDVTILQMWAWSGFHGGHDAEAMDLIERSRWMDPKSPLWDWEIGEYLADTGDFAGAVKAADHCLGPTPSAWLCRQIRGNVEARLGQCKQLEDDARAMIALDPDEPVAYDWLAAALLARGAPVESIADASRRARAHEFDPATKEVHEQHDMVTVAELTGDFAATLALFPRLDRVAAASTSSDVVGNVFNDEAFALTQMGDDKRAVALAEAYMKRFPALTLDEPVAARNVVLRLRHAAHTISDAEFRTTREEWSKEVSEELPPYLANNVWFQFWAEPAATPQEAKEALDALPRYSPLPPYEGIIYHERVMGQVLLLAGRVDEAIPHLQRAQHACFTPDFVPSHQISAELLGEALESKGDKDGACAAYGEVLVRWGNAKPRSVTADKARAHMKTLGCAK
jgi:serine/threonine-protein kinase